METTTNPATTFIFLGTHPDGDRHHVTATAESVSAARYRLEVQGYTDLIIVKDSMNAQIDAANASADVFSEMTLDERMAFEQKLQSAGADRFLFWRFLKSDGAFLALLGLWAWYRATGDRPWGFWSIIAYASVLGFLALVLRLKIPARLYTQLVEARTWNRWDDVERIVRRLRAVRWFTGSLIPEHELLFSEAKAVAGRGDLPAALEKVRPVGPEVTPPADTDCMSPCDPLSAPSATALAPALYYGLLSGVYEAGCDVAGQVASLEKALACDPKSPSARVDLAFALALDARNSARAQAVLQELDPEDLVPMAKPYFDVTCGVLALDAGNYLEAESFLRRAAESWADFGNSNALLEAFGWLIGGLHAVALRRLGRAEEAEDLFAEFRPYLEAVQVKSVLDRWNGR